MGSTGPRFCRRGSSPRASKILSAGRTCGCTHVADGISSRPPSQAAAPAVLPGDPNRVEVVVTMTVVASDAVNLDCLCPSDRQRQCCAEAQPFLPIVILHAINRRAAAREIAGIYRQPKAARESVARVRLHRVERRLLARFAVEEIVVLSIEGDGRRELERPASNSF